MKSLNDVRPLALAIAVVLAVGGNAWWLTRTVRTPEIEALPGAAREESTCASEPVEGFVPAQAEALPRTVAELETETSVARHTPQPRDEPAAAPRDALWVEGRVAIPSEMPADEDLHVEARGRKFANGTHVYEALVAPDGRFRAAFARGTSRGTLRLVARYSRACDDIELDPRARPATGTRKVRRWRSSSRRDSTSLDSC